MMVSSLNRTGKIVIVADDFTGSNDTGVQFSKRHLSSVVIINNEKINELWNDFDVIVIDTESRFDTPDAAYRKAYETGEILKRKKPDFVYKKIDSTFRGNIGAEIAGLMESLGTGHTILVPAFPSNGRITKKGMVYVNGKLLEETEASADPRTPVRDSYIPEIIGRQTDKTIALISHEIVQAGRQVLENKLSQLVKNNIEIIVIDALDDRDMDLIASVTAPLKNQVMFSGSPGFAGFLPQYLNTGNRRKINIVIAGSISNVTRDQIDHVQKNMNLSVIDIDICKLFSGKEKEEIKRILFIINESCSEEKDIIIRSSPSRDSVRSSIEQGHQKGFTPVEVSENIALFLGELTREIIETFSVNGIVLTGGDTAIKTVNALKVSGTVIQKEIEPGIPYGNFIDKKFRNITVVTKAGGFGSREAILRILNFFREGQDK
ncbi:MAG: four-carbon acid sugar kinase family protein [Bacteroidales bacterium]|nr:four-carbon acid sugar kinase family protein [Bacteroidales bacterium]